MLLLLVRARLTGVPARQETAGEGRSPHAKEAGAKPQRRRRRRRWPQRREEVQEQLVFLIAFFLVTFLLAFLGDGSVTESSFRRV